MVDFPAAACDIKHDNIVDALNGPEWIRLRKDFLSGRFRDIPDCKNCSDAEKLGARSSRMGANQHFAHHAHGNLIEQINDIVNNDLKVTGVVSLDYYPSNYCNYSCIMCAGGASSSRLAYEIKLRRIKERVVLNAVDSDFYEVLKRVEILNFTGGETVMQQQVHNLIDYLIQENLSHRITIFLLTNCSTYPESLIEKFRQFHNVVYLCSIDGVGPVIEYQRRGASWPEVEEISLRLIHHEFISTVVNTVLTAVNAPTFVDLVHWFHDNRVPNVVVTPVFRVDHLGIAALPNELKNLARQRLTEARLEYAAQQDVWTDKNTVSLIDSVVTMLDRTPHDPQLLSRFREHIQQEDSASRHRFLDVVPDWQPHW